MRKYLTAVLLLSAAASLWCQPSSLQEAAQYQNKAASSLLNGNFEGAIQELEIAASLYEAAQEWEYYFSCLNQVSNVYLSTGKMDDAKRTAKKALWESIQRLGRDNDEAARAAHRLAEVYSRSGRHAKAIEVHKMGLMIRESIYGSQHTLLADSYDWMAHAWMAAEDFERAVALYQQAMNLRKELLGPQHPDMAISYTNLASLELARKDYPRALSLYEKAFNISKVRPGGNPAGVASTLSSMARVNRLLGKEELAVQQYSEAAFLYRQNPDAGGIDAAEAFHEMAIRNFESGQLSTARAFAQEAVQALAFSPVHDPGLLGRYHQLLGAILMEMGRYEKAAGSYRQALSVKEETSAINYQQWCRALWLSGNLSEALEAANDFLEWAERQGESHSILNARALLGSLLIEKGQVEEGIQQLTNVLNQADAPFWLLQEANQSLGKAYRLKGDHEQAIRQYKQLAAEWEHSRQAGALFFRFKALLAMGGIHSELAGQDRNTLFNLEAALNAFERCDKILARLVRTPLPVSQLVFLLDAQEELYSHAIRSCYNLYQQNQEVRYLKEAFFFSERSKQLSIGLPLLLLPPTSFSQAPQSLLKQEADLKMAVQLLFRDLRNNRFQEEKANAIQDEIERKESQYQTVLDKLEKEAPRYFRLKFGTEPVAPEALSALLQEQSAVLFSYYLDKEFLYVFHFTGASFQLFSRPMDEDFRNGLQSFLQMVSNDPGIVPESSSEAAYQKMAALAKELYKKLLPGHTRKPGQQIFLIPHGILQWLPFEALLPPAPQGGGISQLPYLGLSDVLSYHNSATALKNACEGRATFEYESPFEAFVQAAPIGQVAVKGAYPLTDGPSSMGYFSELARSWAAEHDGHLWEGPMAGEGAFRSLPSTDVLLLALDARAGALPDETFITFLEQKDSSYDNRLYLEEAYFLQKPVALYILASVAPYSTGGAGWQQLAEALQYSGGQSLLFHRWAATGSPSAELLELFLNLRQSNGDVSKSLQEARCAYLSRHGNNPQKAHPYFWAGYLAYSQPVAPLVPSGIPAFWIIAAVAGLIFIGWLVRMH
ncbi:MAG: tetratricopeptide repeat protein [Phaeodactylibacter sp.]|nr:tetratricopeptide repeat protein [Phaeodactylibacter sp.]